MHVVLNVEVINYIKRQMSVDRCHNEEILVTVTICTSAFIGYLCSTVSHHHTIDK